MLTVREQTLLNNLKSLVAQERRVLTQVIEHLQKIYDTRLFAKLGHSTIHKYLIRELGYSHSAAFRRVQALKLVREIPQSKKLIESGELSLSKVTQLQTLLKDKDTDVKENAIKKIIGQNCQESQKTIFEFAPDKEKTPRDTKKKVSRTHTRISMTLSDAVADKLERVKARTKKYNNEELLDFLLDLALKEKRARRSNGSKNTRMITAEVKRHVDSRANGMCEFESCDEIHFLEYDHIKPASLGGSNAKENIRLLCRTHNQLEAIKKLGINKMKGYLKASA